MNHWPFIIAAYGAVIAAAVALALGSWRAMRAAEARAEEMRRR
jgi:hypothetical protein